MDVFLTYDFGKISKTQSQLGRIYPSKVVVIKIIIFIPQK